MNTKNYKKHYDIINGTLKFMRVPIRISKLANSVNYDEQMLNIYNQYKSELIANVPSVGILINKGIAYDMGLIYILKNMNQNPDNLEFNF